METKYIALVILVIVIVLIIMPNSERKEHNTDIEAETYLDDIDIEALQNISSMYLDGVLSVTSLNVTDDINGVTFSDGDISASNITITGTGTADHNRYR